MNKFKLYSVAILLLKSCFLLLSCSSNSINENNHLEIKLDERTPVKISSFTSGMKAVKLETSEKCLLADIREMKIFNDLIFISDVIFKGIYVFDFDGNLVRVLNKEGRGGGEYLSVDDFFIDEIKHEIEIFDRTTMKIYIYDVHNFTFKESFSLPFTFAFKFSKFNDNYFFQTNSAKNYLGNKETNSDIIVYNRSNKKLIPLFEKILPDNENQSWEFGNIFTPTMQNGLFVSFAWKDKIYKIDEEKNIPFLSVDAGSKGYPRNIIEGTYDEKIAFLNSGNVNNKIHFFKLLMHEKNDFIIGYGLGYPPKVCYHMQFNGGNEIINTNNIQNDYMSFKHEDVEIFKSEKGFILSVVYPYKEIDNTELNEHFKIESGDNPIILLFKLK